ncbi:MAG: tetratricopeptide repeat protein [Acidobacteria bacterium]|nr:tetratricopeptide repeat protein [Acidobacteriota bacterium]
MFYRLAGKLHPDVDADFYNQALNAKYKGQWDESLRLNQAAVLINSTNEAAWWNLGIAATALRNWHEAVRAWHALGITFQVEMPEPLMEPSTACVRLNPNDNAEVVWGTRIDPARMVVNNVPLPESGRRYQDVVLHDGAPSGTRTSQGYEYTVFDELELWHASEYSTYEFEVHGADDAAVEKLRDICETAEMGVEDWSTLRYLCEECSRGNPDAHPCTRQDKMDAGMRRMSLAAVCREDAVKVLEAWLEEYPNVETSELELSLSAD